MQSPEEATAVVDLGVDHIGVTPAQRGLPGEVSAELAASICTAVRGTATTVALSVDSDINAIAAMVDIVRPDILHLCGPKGDLGPADVTAFRSLRPSLPIMQAIAVTGPEAIEDALMYATVADYLLLDSVDPSIEGIGAAGIVHDWSLSAAIVEAVDIPVILAGGLGPANVAKAIAQVRPWGVDSLTHTNRPLPSGGFRKDLDLVAQFVAGAGGGERP